MQSNRLVTFASFFLFFSFLFFSSCSKDDEQELLSTQNQVLDNSNGQRSRNFDELHSKFFPFDNGQSHNFVEDIGTEHSAKVENIVTVVYDEMMKMENEDPFVEIVSNKIGLPIWDGFYLVTELEHMEFILTIPFAFEGNENVSGIVYISQMDRGEPLNFLLIESQNIIDYVDGLQEYDENTAFFAFSIAILQAGIFETLNKRIINYFNRVDYNIMSAAGSRDCWIDTECVWEAPASSPTSSPTSSPGPIASAVGPITNISTAYSLMYTALEPAWELDCWYTFVCNFSNFGDWTNGYDINNTNGGNTNNEGNEFGNVNVNSHLNLEERDFLENWINSFRKAHELPFTNGELADWVNYDCITATNPMTCAMTSFLLNFSHATISPLLEDLDIDIITLLSLVDVATCLTADSFADCAWESMATKKHNELLAQYPEYQSNNVDLNTYLSQYGAIHFMATATLYESYIDEVNENPDDEYQWQLAMEVFRDELAPILLEFTPGIGDLIGSYNDFQAGSYFWGCVGIISAIVPGDEIIKVIRKADNIRDGWKKVKKVFTLWNKLFSTIGGQRILNNMPQSWKNLPGSKLSNNSKGLKWKKGPHHEIRVMDADPNSIRSWHQQKYVRMKKNGNFLGTDGIYHQNDGSDAFQILTHLPVDDVTDSWLTNFFN